MFGGFASPEISNRIDDSEPKLIVCGSCGIEPKGVLPYYPMLKEALHQAKFKDLKFLIVQRHDVYIEKGLDPEQWFDYHQEMQDMTEHADCV